MGLLTVLGVPWRLTYLVVIALTLLSVLLLVRVRWPETSVEAAAVPGAAARHRGTRMPARFWLYWCVMLSGVAGEFCTTFWAGDLLAQRLSISPGGRPLASPPSSRACSPDDWAPAGSSCGTRR